MATDLFKNTHRSEMPLTSDYVFRSILPKRQNSSLQQGNDHDKMKKRKTMCRKS